MYELDFRKFCLYFWGEILNTTPTGKKLIGILQKSPNTYTIAIQNSILGNYNTYGSEYRFENRTVYIDPYRSGKINTEKGMQITTKTVTLAHEMGHLTGTKDDGSGQMNNVNACENPVRKELGYPLRGSYESVPGSRSYVPAP
jgi:hypothetical protein